MTTTLVPCEHDDGTSFPKPRPFQIKAHESLREGFTGGHKNQIIMAPTGAGKTYIGLHICNEATRRGKKAVFLCDRTTLINQTSVVADRYGMRHGIIQADHWRTRPEELLQIASVQTIGKRKFWPQMDVLVVDECHTTFKAWTEFAVETGATVIGLSATPFTIGLGKIFTNLVNATTMHDLTESGVLVPMRIFSCSKPDMEGAETAGGEWTDKAAEERELKIVGNVVLDWHKFGDNRKTIVFGATIKHCEELCRKFIESGVMAAVFTCETTATERKALLDEYQKPNSHLKVLISVEALAKGFDCIAEGSEVLTHRGLVAIEKVLYNDKLWDGYEFVSHGGIIYKGERDVITYSGLTATEDHLVKTSTGWIPFGECARLGIPIVCTASGQRHIREDEGRFTNGNNKENHEGCITEPELPMRSVRISDTTAREVVVDRSRVQEMLHAKSRAIMDSGKGKKHEGALRKLIAQGVQRLWGAWNRVQVRVTTTLCELDHGAYATTSQGQEYSIGSDRQQRSLRAGQHSLGEQESKLRKYAARWLGGENSQIQVQLSRNSLRGQNSEEFNINGNEFGRYSQPILQTFGQAKRRVWDVLNAGPRNSFTCEGLLVHNCADVGCICDARPLRKSLSTAIQMWGRGLRSSPETGKVDCHLLDFSGNIVRFFEDFSEVYFNGLDQLDDGNKLDKKIRTKEEFETKGCPKCGYSPFHKRCMSCGYERISRDVMDNVPGSMKEIFIGTGSNKKKLADNSRHLWNQLCSYAKIHSKPEFQSGRSWYLFKQITGRETEWQFSTAPTVEITTNVFNKIRQMNMAYKKAIRK